MLEVIQVSKQNLLEEIFRWASKQNVRIFLSIDCVEILKKSAAETYCVEYIDVCLFKKRYEEKLLLATKFEVITAPEVRNGMVHKVTNAVNRDRRINYSNPFGKKLIPQVYIKLKE